MPNSLTGDFDAVLQISGGTINRLLASMHQNAFVNPDLPSFPHSVRMRIGDRDPIDGVRGVVRAQIGVPRIELIHGATDRFIMEVGVRAWYRPDPATEPFPAFIHGTVRAEYRVVDIDPSCLGWSKLAHEYLWIRVVQDSVTFRGTAEDDQSVLEAMIISPSNPAANIAKVRRQVAGLLAQRFEARPHRLTSQRFRRGALRSLKTPTGETAVALPLALSGEPSGDIHSIEAILLAGWDVAVGVSIEAIMSLVAPIADAIGKLSMTVPVNESGFSTVYHVGVHPPSVQWQPFGSHAVLKISVSGWANTNSVLANATFSIEQNITLGFAAGALSVTPWSPGVKVTANGFLSPVVAQIVKATILGVVPPTMQTVCAKAQNAIGAMTRTSELSEQLATLDDHAAVTLDDAEFLADGVIIRGTIAVAPRRRLVVKTETTVDAHSALDSWIPGGRIDRFEWSWTWAGSGDPGAATHHDRFLLRRPPGKLGRWGIATSLTAPLPGLDGWGTVCLTIVGARVDPVTGEFVTVRSTQRCRRFGFLVLQLPPLDRERVFVRDIPQLAQDVPFPELATLPVVAPSGTSGTAGAVNTLVLRVEGWGPDVAEALDEGLRRCGRYDAGLTLLVLFREGLLDRGGRSLLEEVETFAQRAGIAAVVNEDVNASWARALALRAESGGPAWAIIAPHGLVVWTHEGRIAGDALASALDTHLRRCPDPQPFEYRLGVDVGTRITPDALHPGVGFAVSHCPPVPPGHPGVAQMAVTFVQKRSAASTAHLRNLAGRYGQHEGTRGPSLVVVVDKADPHEVEALTNELGLDVIAVADPAGTIADRFGVRVWPTTLTLDHLGAVSDIEMGVRSRRHDGVHSSKGDSHAGDAAL